MWILLEGRGCGGAKRVEEVQVCSTNQTLDDVRRPWRRKKIQTAKVSNADTPLLPETSSQQPVWLHSQSSARCGERSQSGIKTPLFEMGALHSLENLFIETEEEEGRKNKHTAPFMHLLSVCKLCVQKVFALKEGGQTVYISSEETYSYLKQQNKMQIFVLFCRTNISGIMLQVKKDCLYYTRLK